MWDYLAVGQNAPKVTDYYNSLQASSPNYGEIYTSAAASSSTNNSAASNTSAADDDSSFNVINGTRRDDELIGTTADDQLRGYKGDDIIYGGPGDDAISGEKGNDILSGGSGEDHFVVSTKWGKGKKNMDVIVDFEVGSDLLMVLGSTKKLRIRYIDGDVFLVRGKKDIIAVVEGAGNQLDWNASYDDNDRYSIID